MSYLDKNGLIRYHNGIKTELDEIDETLTDLEQDLNAVPSNKVSVHLDAVRKHDGVLLKPTIFNATDKFLAVILQYDCYYFRSGNSRPHTYCVAAELYVPLKYRKRISCGSISVRKRDNTELINLETPNATINRSSVLVNSGGTLFVNMGFNASDYDETNKYASQRCFIELYTDENKTTVERVIYADQINFEYISADPFTMNVERTYIEIDDVITLGFYTSSDDACVQGVNDPTNSDYSQFPMLSKVSGGQSEVKEQHASYLYPYVSTNRRVFAVLRIGHNEYSTSNAVDIHEPDTAVKINITTGQTFCLDGLWYTATTDLAIGDTLVVGTNCEAVEEPVIDTGALKEDLNQSIYGDGLVKYTNMFDASTATDGYIKTNNGDTTETGYSHSDYIAVDPTKTYTFRGCYANKVQIVFYDENKNYVKQLYEDQVSSGSYSGGHLSVNPSNLGYSTTAFVVVNMTTQAKSTYMFIEGSTYPSVYIAHAVDGFKSEDITAAVNAINPLKVGPEKTIAGTTQQMVKIGNNACDNENLCAIAIGNEALKVSTHESADDGYFNVAIGHQAMKSATTADHDTAIGYQALKNTTTGKYNTAIGEDSMMSNTTGLRNVAIGCRASQAQTSGDDNTVVGALATYSTTPGKVPTGSKNTYIGAYAGQVNDDGSGNTAVGYYAGRSTPDGVDYSTAIGYQAYATKNNQVVLGSNVVDECKIYGNKLCFRRNTDGKVLELNFNQDGTVTWSEQT